MRRTLRHIFSALAVLAVMSVFGGCVEHLEETVYLPTDYVSFKVSLNGNVNALPVKGMTDFMDFEEEEWILEGGSAHATKAELSSYLTGSAGVYGYVYEGEWDEGDCSPTIDCSEYSFDGDELKADAPTRWSEVDGEASDGSQFRVFAYAPYDAVTPTFQTPGIPAAQDSPAVGPKGAPVIKISDVMAKDGDDYLYQTDIIVADTELPMSSDKNHRKEIPLDFEHIFTAVQFQAGFDCTITGITINGIKTGGKYVIGTGWTETTTGTISLNDSDIENTMLIIPQQIPVDDPNSVDDNVTITVTYTDGTGDHTMSASLNGVEWRQGKKITYTLRNERKYIYLDLAAGNVEITGNSYTGYVFVNKEIKLVSGTRTDNQEYYIYQSCVTEVNNTETAVNGTRNYKVGYSEYDSETEQGKGTLTLPSYPPVMHNKDQLWSDYIVNNTNVQEVINAWDNEAGAGKASIDKENLNSVNGSGAAGAVRNAGREATKNRIHVEGYIGEVRMIIDNIYSSYQQRENRSTDGAVRKREKGGISFRPDQGGTDSRLTIHIIGDNRLGCVNYTNYKDKTKNSLIFEGSGSLTVADTDYYRIDEGMGSNRGCSVIGGKDILNNSNGSDGEDEAYNIIINSGVIYAGATTSSCTAIGGGGNGEATVTINGGTITAVAKTTGTAIGGGAGGSFPGGPGTVTITNGNVYAYNFNDSTTPSSAIGAAGSTEKPGGDGVINISGGYVYAYSGNGTAIGGGSSAKRYGGKGIITITGGTVIAKSGNENSAGIGGGSSYASGYKPLTGESKNGGDAVITISGNPVIRTGSIGGGTPGYGAENGRNGKIGSAQINVTGGDIQAQFVMADSPNNKFVMRGGVIRNSATSDNEYYCIQPNGGAVYMEKGKFEMSGGIIKDCSADENEDAKGGAVYIKGDEDTEFKMTAGIIQNCEAASDGGAVYLEGGNVIIEGGTIQGNVASNGNGGAISIVGGNFTLNGADADVTQNAAFSTSDVATGSGGGIYVAPAQNSSGDIVVQLLKGNLTSNSSARNGGGICMDMGTNETAGLDVTVGNVSDGEATAAMNISSNNARGEGGGMYVSGANAAVTLNDGYVKDNETSSYQVNPDISVDGGVVTLMKSGITTQATVKFSDNAQYYTQGNTADQIVEQHVVIASLCKLNANTFSLEGYTFAGWNTRRDGRGESYTNEQVTTLEEDITLYAQWQQVM